MNTTISKIVFAGDSITYDTADEVRSGPDWIGWTDIVKKELDAECVITAEWGLTVEKLANNIDKYILSYNPTHVILNGGVTDILFKNDTRLHVSSIEFISIVCFEMGIDFIFLHVPALKNNVDCQQPL